MSSRIFFRTGRQAWPEHTTQPTEEGKRAISYPDCIAVRFEIFDRPLGEPGCTTIERGFGLYVAGSDRGEIDTFNWPEHGFTPEFYARLAQEIELKLGKQNLTIVVS